MKADQNDNASDVSALAAETRVILSMGGKGGVGKTSLMVALAEWLVPTEEMTGALLRDGSDVAAAFT